MTLALIGTGSRSLKISVPLANLKPVTDAHSDRGRSAATAAPDVPDASGLHHPPFRPAEIKPAALGFLDVAAVHPDDGADQLEGGSR